LPAFNDACRGSIAGDFREMELIIIYPGSLISMEIKIDSRIAEL
jgi:hypothetical protein